MISITSHAVGVQHGIAHNEDLFYLGVQIYISAIVNDICTLTCVIIAHSRYALVNGVKHLFHTILIDNEQGTMTLTSIVAAAVTTLLATNTTAIRNLLDIINPTRTDVLI